MRKYKRALIWLAAIVLLLAIGAAAAWQIYVHPLRQFNDNAGLIQMAVERFAVDTQGSYPIRIEALIEMGYFKDWPPNPLAPGTMHPIAADATPVPGCFVYVPMGPEIIGPKGPISQQQAAAQGVIFPSEVDGYELVFYGRIHYNAAVWSARAGTHAVSTIKDQMEKQIRWDQVALVITAGENYISH